MKSARQKIPLCLPCYLFFASLAINTAGFSKKKKSWLNLLCIKRANIPTCAFLSMWTLQKPACIFTYTLHTFIWVESAVYLGLRAKFHVFLLCWWGYFVPMYAPLAGIPVLLCFSRLYFCGHSQGICTYVTLKQHNYFYCARVLCVAKV